MAILELLQRGLPVVVAGREIRLSRLQMDVLINEIQKLWLPAYGNAANRVQLYCLSREQLAEVESPHPGVTTDLIFDQCPAIRVGPDGSLHWRIVDGAFKLDWLCSLESTADEIT